jgi:hypothetical protein
MISDQVKARIDTALGAVEDEALRRGIVEIFEIARQRAQAGEVDVVVLAARRLACVYQLLVAQGMPELTDSCAIVSDRFLDVPWEWEWRNALILDDSVVLGTTLLRLYDDIVERVGEHGTVSSLAVCLDEEQCAEFLLDAVNFESRQRRSTMAVEAFSQQLVDALFSGGIPLFSDYPTTRPIPLSTKQWEDHLHNDGWHIADVTAPLFANRPQQTYSHIPTDATLDDVLSRLAEPAARLVEGLKVRSYFTYAEDGGVSVRFVPIAMLGPSTPEQLDSALNSIGAIAEVADVVKNSPLQWSKWGHIAKHRLVQLYVATCILDEVLALARQSSDHAEIWELDRVQTQLYFGPRSDLIDDLVGAVIANFRSTTDYTKGRPAHVFVYWPQPSWLLEDESLLEVLWANRELLAVTGQPAEPASGEVSRVGLIFGHAVSSIFGFINDEFEVPQRKEIRQLSGVAEYRKTYSHGNQRRVLSQGLTLRDLTVALLPDSQAGSSWERALISLAIDIGNDLGIIVPKTRYDDVRHVVYRSYRLGETAPLASTPLPTAVETGQWDRYSQAAAEGFPIRSEVTPITERTALAHGPNLMDKLRADTLEAVPGRIVIQRDGEVLAIDDESFMAQFSDPRNGGMQIARIPRSQLSESDDHAMGEGALVWWTIFQRISEVTPDRTSRIRVRREPLWDTTELKKNAAALSFLADAS